MTGWELFSSEIGYSCNQEKNKYDKEPRSSVILFFADPLPQQIEVITGID